MYNSEDSWVDSLYRNCALDKWADQGKYLFLKDLSELWSYWNWDEDTWQDLYSGISRAFDNYTYDDGTKCDPDIMRSNILSRALFNAAKCGNDDACKILIGMGAETDILITKTHTAVMVAAENGHLDCVKTLRKNKVLMRYKVPYYGIVDAQELAKSNGYKL